jgi:DNA-binding transcriptional MerR regulator
MRIGELARRTGVSVERLRAWERRYGLLEPARSEGGYRLYASADEARVRRMTTLIAAGQSAAEAARDALTAPVEARAGRPRGVGVEAQSYVGELVGRLQDALDDFDAAAAHAAIDSLLAIMSVEAFVGDVVIPYLQELGKRWERGSATVAQEHFASNILRGRLLGLTRDWDGRGDPAVVLACVPGELHDLGLLIFGLLVARRGWRVTFLGADTPLDTVRATALDLRPAQVVLASFSAARFAACLDDVRDVAQVVRVGVAGAAEPADIEAAGAYALPGDIVEAARALAA